MKFFELADALHPLVPGGLARAPYLRELISMFTTVTETEWTTRADPSFLPSDATLERMASTDSAFTKKLAKAITARWGIKNFVNILDGLELETQQLITDNIAAYGEQVRLDHFPDDVARLLVEIIHDKAGIDKGKEAVLEEIAIQTARVRYEKLVLARSRGCTKCSRPLGISSHGQQTDSYTIVFLDADQDEYTAEDFAALCKPCAERYELSHTPQDIAELRRANRFLSLNDHVDEHLVPLGLDQKIADLLIAIYNLPVENLAPNITYDVMPMQEKLDDTRLVRRVRDHMSIYESVVREKAKSLEEVGKLDFERMRDDIWGAWRVLVDAGLSQDEIWSRLTEWIHRHTNVDEYACGVVVSFLTQICELFKPRRQIL
ncbi:ABC-three component system protein [Arcanobacterium hippocoleae]